MFKLLRKQAADRLFGTAAGRKLHETLDRRRLRLWHDQGCPMRTPHAYKRMLVCGCARQYGLKAFVETGTQYGDMPAGVMDAFETVYSIELHPGLFKFSRRRFAGISKIHLVQGDSADMLPGIIAGLDTDALFFLDAHYFRHGISARGRTETPVLEELAAILADRRRHSILIDDARCFTPERGFPGIKQLEELVSTRNTHLLTIRHDIIRIVPKDQPLVDAL